MPIVSVIRRGLNDKRFQGLAGKVQSFDWIHTHIVTVGVSVKIETNTSQGRNTNLKDNNIVNNIIQYFLRELYTKRL